MYHALKQVFEFRTTAIDGELGRISDCYFDDADWAVRYFVVSDSDATAETKYLISRVAVSRIDWHKRRLFVQAARRKILESPEFTEDMPVSRQYEIALHRYYEWPVYWGQLSFMDDESALQTKMSLPENDVVEMDAEEVSPDQELEGNFKEPVDDELQQMEFGQPVDDGRFDPSLRSVREMIGYTIRAEEGELGRVSDFVCNDKNRGIEYIVINSGIQNETGSFLVPITWVNEISWQSTEVRVSVKRDSVINAPPYDGGDSVSDEFIRNLLFYIDGLDAP